MPSERWGVCRNYTAPGHSTRSATWPRSPNARGFTHTRIRMEYLVTCAPYLLLFPTSHVGVVRGATEPEGRPSGLKVNAAAASNSRACGRGIHGGVAGKALVTMLVVCGGGRVIGHDGYEYGRVVRIGGGDGGDRAQVDVNASGHGAINQFTRLWYD